MKKESALLTVLLVAVCAFAQSRPVVLAPNFCTDFPAATQACESFKDLMTHRDATVLDMFPHGDKGATYVCFVEQRDEFSVVSFSIPAAEKSSEGAMVGKSKLYFDEYRDGIQAIPGPRSTELVWNVMEVAFSAPTHRDPLKIRAVVGINEIHVLKSLFADKSGSTPEYEITIHRSTGRFRQTFSAHETKLSETGRCAVFQGM